MLTTLSAPQILDREFLNLRAKILELAALLDRLNRSPGDVQHDPRMEQLERALAVLQSKQSDRAEQVQLIFSLPYEKNWKRTLGLDSR